MCLALWVYNERTLIEKCESREQRLLYAAKPKKKLCRLNLLHSEERQLISPPFPHGAKLF